MRNTSSVSQEGNSRRLARDPLGKGEDVVETQGMQRVKRRRQSSRLRVTNPDP